MVDEEYWQPHRGQAQQQPWLSRYLNDPDELPAGSLFKASAKITQLVVEVLEGGPPNVLLTQLVVEVLSDYPRVTEDYWQNPVRPVPDRLWRSPVREDIDDVPAGFLFAPRIATEEYWQNRVLPVAARLYQKLPLGDPEELPAGSLFIPAPLHVQEDYWQQLVKPVAAYIYQKLPIGDPEEIPADHLFASFLDVSQLVIEVITSYDRQVYTGWTGTSMCVN